MSELIIPFEVDGLKKDTRSIELVGGKGANLLKLASLGQPVPPGFVVTTTSYRQFLESRGLDDEIATTADTDSTDQETLENVEQTIKRLILREELPTEIREAIVDAYARLGDDTSVAVRSSATDEDLVDASFAGQLETFLNITTPEDVLQNVQKCWASLFTQRCINYRIEKGFDLVDVDVAVVVQKMIDAEKSGVIFTAHPETGADETTIEATWGLGEAVVSGAVSPDQYIVPGDGTDIDNPEEQISTEIKKKLVMYRKAAETGETVKRDVPEELQTQQVLSVDEIQQLVEIGKEIEAHFGQPQDIEWAIADDEIYVLQARPITTISKEQAESEASTTGQALAEGLGVCSGVARGRICLTPIDAVKQEKSGEKVIFVREQTSPSDMHGIKAAEGILTSLGGTTSHAAIVSRELGKPAVVGCDQLEIDFENKRIRIGDKTFEEGDHLAIDSSRGVVMAE